MYRPSYSNKHVDIKFSAHDAFLKYTLSYTLIIKQNMRLQNPHDHIFILHLINTDN